MQDLVLIRLKQDLGAFSQYVPRSFHPLMEKPETVCVGAVYNGMACAAALAEETEPGEYYLRYVFVDPAARLCGLGTYLVRGLLGEVKAAGARQLKAVYSPSMLEGEEQTLHILTRAGFSKPKPISTAFSTRLADIPSVRVNLPEEMAVYSALDVPEAVRLDYEALVEKGSLPSFATPERLKDPDPQLCSFCTVKGSLSGLLLVDRLAGGYQIAGLYVLPSYRSGRTAAALLARTIEAAKAILPSDTQVWTSAIDRGGFSLCDKLLRQGRHAQKETEFYAIYQF